MGSIKPRIPVWRKAFNGQGTDEYGNDIESWADPVKQLVYGISYDFSDELYEEGHNAVLVNCALLVPVTFEVNERDRYILRDGKEYEVIGPLQTTTGNPFGWKPGGRVNLKRHNG